MSVTRQGCELPKIPDIAALVKKELKVAPFSPIDTFPKSINVYKETASAYITPLFWARKHFPHLHDARSTTPCAPMPFVFRGGLKPDLQQPQAVDATLAQLRATGGAMLCLKTGYGKTCCALYIAAQLGRKTLIVVHKEFLMQQWIERIKQHFPPDCTITKVQGTSCDVSGNFVIAMLQTLVSRRYPPALFQSCGLVIVDEAHHISAPGFSSAMFSLCAPYTLGLSATPDRADKLGHVVQWFLGDIAYQTQQKAHTSVSVMQRVFWSDEYANPQPRNRRGDVCFTSVITALAQDPRRTLAIADEVVELVKLHRQVLVLSHRREHCSQLAAQLRQRGVDCCTYLGGDKTVPAAQVIVATYALTSEGFDCPRLNALVFATPASNVEQSCGRVMRGSAATSALIVDIVDNWGVCFAQAAKRRAFYKKAGFTFHAPGGHPSPADDNALPDYAFSE